MELIVTDNGRKETGILLGAEIVDIDIGETNDFQIQISRENSKKYNLTYGCYIYSPETEFGGIIEELESDTSTDFLFWRGYCWRGYLDQIITKPSISGTEVINTEANTAIRNILSAYGLGRLFTVSNEDSGMIIKNCRIPRYYSALKVIERLLNTVNAKLSIKGVQGGSGEAFSIQIKAVPVNDYSNTLEYSANNDSVTMKINDYRRGFNHIVCLGSGELEQRLVVDLYVQGDGTIGRTQVYTGVSERTAVYENTNCDDLETLIEEGTDRLKELQNYKEQELSVSDIDLDIGDIIAGRDYDTDAYLAKPITAKILELSNNEINVSYKVKGAE